MENNIISISRGNTLYLKLRIDMGGDLYNLKNDDEVYFTVKTHCGGKTVLKKKLTSNDTDSKGELVLIIEPSDTENLSAGSYFYDAAVRIDREFYTFIKPAEFIVTGVITEKEDYFE